MTIFITGATGYIGGSVAVALIARGQQVRGLVRSPEKASLLTSTGVTPVLGDLDDTGLLAREAQASEGVVNAADSDHRAALEALIAGLSGSGKPLLHTSGSSIVADEAHGDHASDRIFNEDTPLTPQPGKAARVAIDQLARDAARRDVRSAVLCNTMIYGTGKGLHRDSVQVPRLIAQARESGIARHIGRGANIWSNVHIDDMVDLYLTALDKAPAGAFYFVENGEASFREIAEAISHRLGLGAPQSWPFEAAIEAWGYAQAAYTFGSNSRVRGLRARRELDWRPKHSSLIEWIAQEG